MKVYRTIHPIGQGAFYTGHLQTTDGVNINVVYDCGCCNSRKVQRKINRKLMKTFAEDRLKICCVSEIPVSIYCQVFEIWLLK